MSRLAITLSLLAAISLQCSYAESMQCEHKKPNVPSDWIDMSNPCVLKMREQIQEELKAAMRYMAMGAYFSKDSINLMGFAEMFFKSASEEREHAIKLINYLLMRGELTSAVSNLIAKNLNIGKIRWENAVEALRDALNLETGVTQKIKEVISTCENANVEVNNNDYHLVDYLSGEFLDEQYKGQRHLAGMISTLDKMMHNHGELGIFLYDKKLLNNEV